MPLASTNHIVSIADQQITIGLFRSTSAQIKSPLGIAEIRDRLLSEVPGMLFSVGGNSEVSSEQRFEAGIPPHGTNSKLNWQVFGSLVQDGPVTLMNAGFRISPLLKMFFLLWLAASGLFILVCVLVAARSNLQELWLLPLAGLVVMLGGYGTLNVARAVVMNGIRRVAQQLSEIS